MSGAAKSDDARCPFLREAQVRFCRASAYHKMILRAPGQPENERCSSPAYVSCPMARQYREEVVARSHCPFLQESLVQYCSAASITKYIPYSEASMTRCGRAAFHYCDIYLSFAQPEARPVTWAQPETRQDPGAGNPGAADLHVGPVPMPSGMSWASNHMWLDEAPDGSCHIGVDAFLTGVLGRVDAVSFPAGSGLQRPAVVLRVNDVDFPMIFPAKIFISNVNTRVKISPGRLVEEPYRQGWLVEGRTAAWGEDRQQSVVRGLLTGRNATEWMGQEVERIDRFAHDELTESPGGTVLVQDGGQAARGLGSLLPRESLLRLFNEFFSPCDGRRGG